MGLGASKWAVPTRGRMGERTESERERGMVRWMEEGGQMAE